mgnify:CR=1 FL=1
MTRWKNGLTISATSFNKKTFKVRKKTPEWALTKNHESKSIKFRLRVQQQREAENELKEFKNEDGTRAE